MSIQSARRRKLYRRVINKVGIEPVLTKVPLFLEKLYRKYNHDYPKVYYPYRFNTLDLHPFFERYYTSPPLKYSNINDSDIFYWVSSPLFRDKAFILEPNDHPLSPSLKPEPIDAIRNVNIALDIYSDDNCKKIVVESDGALELYKHYVPDIINKCEVIHIGAIARKTPNNLNLDKLEKGIRFLCLASDYRDKGVDLIVLSWLNCPATKNSSLVIACPNVPENIQNMCINKRVAFVNKGPLTKKNKICLYRNADVVLAPTHIDGGGNVYEALEYGLPVITMRNQRATDQINNNGFIIDTPFYYYDKDKFGFEWKTFADFISALIEAKKNGAFDCVTNGFIDNFKLLIENPQMVIEMGAASYSLARNELSLERRNRKLLKMFNDVNDEIR